MRDVWMLTRRRYCHDPLIRMVAERIVAMFERDAAIFMQGGG